MKTRIRILSLFLALMTVCTFAWAESAEEALFESEWKQMKEISKNGKEKSMINGSIYAVYRFEEGLCTSTAYQGDRPMMEVYSECIVDGSRITMTRQKVSRSGNYTIEGDTLTIAWDDGAFLIFERMPDE